MKLQLADSIKLHFKNNEGEKTELEITVSDLIKNNIDDFYEMLEDDCNCSSCYNESQNFCDCAPMYEDYTFTHIETQAD